MNRFLLLLIFSAGILFANAQSECPPPSSAPAPGYLQNGCGTTLNPKNAQAYLQMVDRMNQVDVSRSDTGMQWIPIEYHVITRDSGQCGANLKSIYETQCQLNEDYNKFNFGFYINAIDTIKDTYIWTYDNDAIGAITFAQYNVKNVCNVYVNGNLPGLCGYASLPQLGDSLGGGIFLNKDCIGGKSNVLHHEMGHYFSLLHTFEPSIGIEFVDGSNCSTAGDLICDTPADFPDHPSSCPYEGDHQDGHGDYYRNVTDASIYMSYFDDRCKNKFTPGERSNMKNCLQQIRYYLLGPHPDTSPLDATDFVFPKPGDSAVNSSNVTVTWHPVKRAQLYRFILRNENASYTFIDTLLNDTAVYIGEMNQQRTYQYIVQPLCNGNACHEKAEYHYFTTSPITVAQRIVSPDCSTSNDTLVVTPKYGNAPYTFFWSNSYSDSMLVNIPGGDYTVTITDNSNQQVIQNIKFFVPDPLLVEVKSTINNLVADATGGTAPYTYHWSNGVDNKFNNHPTFGSYSVTVTDAKSCATVTEFVYSAIGIVDAPKVLMKIFPNPSYSARLLNIQLELNDRTNAEVDLIDLAGEVVQQHKKEFLPGSNNMAIDVSALPAGIYFVKYTGAEATQTLKFSLIR